MSLQVSSLPGDFARSAMLRAFLIMIQSPSRHHSGQRKPKGGALVELTLDADLAAYLDPHIAQTVMQNLSSARPRAQGSHDGLLSDRALKVLAPIVAGHSNTVIGEQLYLSPNTVKTA
ncbi:MAG: LuxR C-terminal-related transcriptional regulator [Cyanobacteria bacterium J06638_6]